MWADGGFKGTTDATTRRVLGAYIPELPDRVVVLCSGNFTIETMLRLNGYRGHMTGNDVSLYSVALGNALVGRDWHLDFAADDEMFERLRPLLGDPVGNAVAVMVALEYMSVRGYEGPHYRRVERELLRDLDSIVLTTKNNVERHVRDVALDEFRPADAWDVLDEVPDDGCVICFPPTYAGGYEKLYAKLEGVCEWDGIDYEELSQGHTWSKRIAESGKAYVMMTEFRDIVAEMYTGPPVAETYRGVTKSVWFYSNMGLTPLYKGRELSTEAPMWKRFSDEQDITRKSRIEMVPIKSPEAAYFRAVYIGPAPQSGGELNYALTIDGAVFAVVIWCRGRRHIKLGGETRADSETALLMADTALPSKRYRRLSKLAIMLAASKEMKHLLDSAFMEDVRFAITVAYTKKPTSAKYRGAWKLAKRYESMGKDALLYYCEMGERNVREILDLWTSRYGKDSTRSWQTSAVRSSATRSA